MSKQEILSQIEEITTIIEKYEKGLLYQDKESKLIEVIKNRLTGIQEEN